MNLLPCIFIGSIIVEHDIMINIDLEGGYHDKSR